MLIYAATKATLKPRFSEENSTFPVFERSVEAEENQTKHEGALLDLLVVALD